MKFAAYQASRIGGRKYNQDRVAYAYTDCTLLLVLADGMGGHLHGELAAQIAIDTFMHGFSVAAQPRIANPEQFLRDMTTLAHQAIMHYSAEHQLAGHPGTTCVAALVQDGAVSWAHAGDSRFYLLRNQQVVAVTHDHSAVQQWADWGIISHDEMKTHPDRNKITNCLGAIEDEFYVESSSTTVVQTGDILLLCSDGLWSPLQDSEMILGLAQTSLFTALDGLIGEALRRDPVRADNASAVVVRLGAAEQEQLAVLPVCIVLPCQD